MTRHKRNILAAIGLFFVAPLVAEFLLGNLSLKLLPALIVLAPMYGGGALLIRETARRTRRGWPTIFLLGAAYTLIEEGFVTQSLFNPDYLRLHMHLLDHAWIPALGIGAWWTLFMFNLHTFWSIAVSIALVEAVVPSRPAVPWLSRIGDTICAAIFLLGLFACGSFTVKQDHFVSSNAQFLAAGVVCVLLIALAFLLPVRPQDEGLDHVSSQAASQVPSSSPNSWFIGIVAFAFGLAVLIVPSGWNWVAAVLLLALDLFFLGIVSVLAQRTRWLPVHTFSLAAGGALAYGLHAFVETPVGSGAGTLARIGNVIFLAAAIALIVAGGKRSSQAGSSS